MSRYAVGIVVIEWIAFGQCSMPVAAIYQMIVRMLFKCVDPVDTFPVFFKPQLEYRQVERIMIQANQAGIETDWNFLLALESDYIAVGI